MTLQHAKLVNISKADEPAIDVLFNPTEYEIERAASYAELQVPGLATPLYQFVRGDARTLNLELFLDRTKQNRNVEQDLRDLRQFVLIDPELHAPPVCRFEWGNLRFPGVVTSLREKMLLFDEGGHPLRARVTMVLKRYRSAEVQRRDLRLRSPDHTRVRVVREGETLAQIAQEAYGDPRFWRRIAEANGIDRPRFVAPGTTLRIPAVV